MGDTNRTFVVYKQKPTDFQCDHLLTATQTNTKLRVARQWAHSTILGSAHFRTVKMLLTEAGQSNKNSVHARTGNMAIEEQTDHVIIVVLTSLTP